MKRLRKDGQGFILNGDGNEPRRKRRIHTWEEEERVAVDSLRTEPPGAPFYGQIEDLEEEPTSGQAKISHLVLECFAAAWFDQFADDLSDLPPWNTVAQAAVACVADLSLGAAQLADVVSRLDGAVHFHRGAWLKLWFAPRNPHGGDSGVPVRIYLPAAGSNDPRSIGTTGVETSAFVVTGIRRVRPTQSGLRKLNRLRELP